VTAFCSCPFFLLFALSVSLLGKSIKDGHRTRKNKANKKKITKSNHSQSYRLEAEKHIENTQRFYSIAHMKDAKKKKKRKCLKPDRRLNQQQLTERLFDFFKLKTQKSYNRMAGMKRKQEHIGQRVRQTCRSDIPHHREQGQRAAQCHTISRT